MAIFNADKAPGKKKEFARISCGYVRLFLYE
jgi:hypothetical protein